LRKHIGIDTDSYWLTAAVAEELYLTRRAISQARFDDLTDF
jgi:hypothetical protein